MTEGGRTVLWRRRNYPRRKFEAAGAGCSRAGLLRKFGLFNFTRWLFRPKADAPMPKGWVPDPALPRGVPRLLAGRTVSTFTEAEFYSGSSVVTKRLTSPGRCTSRLSTRGGSRCAEHQPTDPEVAKPVDAMPKANALIETTKKLFGRAHNAARARARRGKDPPSGQAKLKFANPTAQIVVLDAGGQYCHRCARKVRIWASTPK